MNSDRHFFLKNIELEIKDLMLNKLLKTDLTNLEAVKILSDVSSDFVKILYVSTLEEEF